MVEDGFDLLLGDRVILRHRVDAPAFRIAKGNPKVTMVRGNFRHEDAPTDELVPRYVVSEKRQQVRSDIIVEVGLADRLNSDTQLNLEFVFTSEDFADQLGPVGESGASLELTTNLPDYDRIQLDFLGQPDEQIWGGGEQMSYLNLRGRMFPIWTSEPGVGREPGTAITDIV
ncbi:MAG TPA: hypothetical protein VGN36_00245, partial [Sphingorhabdus sp.]|nr:hypothetical protein [Sphingorhabdus sp.]